MVIPFMTIYCTQKLHFSITDAGIIMALFGAGAVAGAFIGGKITDKIGFYDLQVFALLSGGVFFIMLSFLRTFWPIAIGVFILSMCNDSFRPANSAAIAYYSTAETKTRSYSLNRLAVNLGWAFGGAIGGIVASINYNLLFWVDGCTNIIAALFLLKLIPRKKIVEAVRANIPTQKVTSPYSDHLYVFFIVLVTLFGTCFFQIFAMQPVFYKTQWHLSEEFIGLTMAVSGLMITFVEMVLVHNLEGKKHQMQYISIGVLIVGLALVLNNILPPAPSMAMLMAITITVGEMMSMPFMSSFWIERTTPYNRGQYAALYTIAWSTAQIIAPTVGSLLINYSGYATLWWVLGAVCVVVSASFFGIYLARYRSVIDTKTAAGTV